MFFFRSSGLRSARARGREGCFDSPLPTSGLHSPHNELRGCWPLTNPKRKSKPKNASRFAKTSCGAQRPLRALSGTRVLLTAAPTAPPCIRRRAAVVAVALFSRFSHLLLRSRLYALAEREVLRKRNTIGGAVNRRSTKNAFSEAASIFVLRQLLWGLKGASSPFLVPPAPRK